MLEDGRFVNLSLKLIALSTLKLSLVGNALEEVAI